MADPLTMAVATAVAGKVAEGLTGQARQALAAIAGKIRERIGRRSADLAVVDDGPPEALAELLGREFAADPAFRDEIRGLWLQAAPAATDNAVSNVFSGQADRVVQARDVHGDINL